MESAENEMWEVLKFKLFYSLLTLLWMIPMLTKCSYIDSCSFVYVLCALISICSYIDSPLFLSNKRQNFQSTSNARSKKLYDI